MSNPGIRERISPLGHLHRGWLLPGLLLAAVSGCVTAADSPEPERQPLTISMDGVSDLPLQVEIAADPTARRTGLMFRHHLPARTGMLFDYRQEQTVQMWMKNMLIPLDMLFIDANGRIVQIVENTRPGSEALIASDRPVRAVLEINAGSVERHGIRVGNRVRHAIFDNRPADLQ
ncbi:MAG: DUF192 domain-containing protein [Gammaproteobacteria bacterium]|nr:DUF192 domain-containing protein [Gammaproteobacteria bacterium]